MMANVFAAGLDALYLLWFWVPGVAWAAVWGFRHWVDIAGFGFVISALVGNLTFLLMYLVGQPELFVVTVRSVLAVLFAIALFTLKRHVRSFLLVAGVATVIVGVAAIMRNIFRLDGWLIGYDHIVTAIAAHFVQSGDLGEQTISEAIYKKGLTFPIIFALGRENLLLGVVPVVIFALLLAVTYRLVMLILDKNSWRKNVVLWGVAVVLWGTADMFWGFPFYQHGHVIVALGIALYTTLMIQYLKSPSLSRRLSGALVVTGIVLTQSRFEAFIVTFFLSLPVLWSLREKSSGRTGIFHAFSISLAWPVGYSLWIGALGSFPVSGMPISLVVVGGIAGSLIAAALLYSFPQLQQIFIYFVLASLLGATAAFLFFARSGEDWNAFYANTFQGEGGWENFWWIPVIAVVFLTFSRKTSIEALVLWLTVGVVLLTILVKTTDGLRLGRLGRIRVGWGDSVNRTLFHGFPLITVSYDKIFSTIRDMVQGRKRGSDETAEVS